MRIENKDKFHSLLVNCCEALLNNEDELFELIQRRCGGIEITFTIEPDNVPTLSTKITQMIIGGY